MVSPIDRWMGMGALLWPRTYGAGHRKQSEIAPVVDAEFGRLGEWKGASTGISGMFAAAWADCAYPKIVTSHRHAAALMCTKVDKSIVADLKVPWKAFAVSVPNGLLTIKDREYDSIGILVAPDEEVDAIIRLHGKDCVAKFVILISGQEGDLCMSAMASTLEAGLLHEAEEHEFLTLEKGSVPVEVEAKRRVMLCARRLVVGMLVGLQTENFVDRESRSASKRTGRRRGLPEHRNIFVRPQAISVDCRPALKDYLSTLEGDPPVYQTLVRGHYKRQACGQGRLDRKVIWIEPYWRGPEEAEIVVRPYTVGKDASA
jgi:hypothetical protein